MPSRTEATRAKAALCATGRLTLLRLFSTLPVCSPKSQGLSEMAMVANSRTFVMESERLSQPSDHSTFPITVRGRMPQVAAEKVVEGEESSPQALKREPIRTT